MKLLFIHSLGHIINIDRTSCVPSMVVSGGLQQRLRRTKILSLAEQTGFKNLTQVPPLLCPQPSRAPTSLVVKDQFPSLSSLPPCLPLAQSALSTRASRLFLQPARSSLAPGPLHWLCPLLRVPFPQFFAQLVPPHRSGLSSNIRSSDSPSPNSPSLCIP